jgi:hypothetical protein
MVGEKCAAHREVAEVKSIRGHAKSHVLRTLPELWIHNCIPIGITARTTSLASDLATALGLTPEPLVNFAPKWYYHSHDDYYLLHLSI